MFRCKGRVATRFCLPGFISAVASCSTMPPMSWTSSDVGRKRRLPYDSKSIWQHLSGDSFLSRFFKHIRLLAAGRQRGFVRIRQRRLLRSHACATRFTVHPSADRLNFLQRTVHSRSPCIAKLDLQQIIFALKYSGFYRKWNTYGGLKPRGH